MADRETIGEIDVILGADAAQMNAEFLELQRRIAQSMDRIENSLKGMATSAERTGRQTRTAVHSMGADFKKFGNDLEAIMNNAGGRMQRFARDVRSMSGSFSVIAGISTLGVGHQFVNVAGGFEQQLNIIKVLSGGTADEIERLSKQAQDLGANTARTAGEVAAGALELQKMGRSLDDINKILPSVTNFSVAADMPMDRAANLAQSTLTQFRMDAGQTERVMDMLMRGANQSAADVGDFAIALSYAGQQAKNANISLEDTIALMEAASQGGIPGSRLGTGLQSVINDLYMPNMRQASIFRRLGIETKDATGKMRDFYAVAQDIFDKMPRAQWNMFEVDTQNYLMTLQSQGLDSVKARRQDLVLNAAGEAARTAQARMQGLKGALETTAGAFDTLLIRIGESGALEAFTHLVARLGDMIQSMSDADAATLQMAAALGAITLAATPLMFALSGIITMLSNPIGWAILLAGAAAAGAAYSALSNRIDAMKSALERIKPLEVGLAKLRAQYATETGNAAAKTWELIKAKERELELYATQKRLEADKANAGAGRGIWWLGGDGGVIDPLSPFTDTAAEKRVRANIEADQAEKALQQAREQSTRAYHGPGKRKGGSVGGRPVLGANGAANQNSPLGSGFSGYGDPPSVERAKALRNLEAQIEAANDGARALQVLQMAQQTFDQAQQAGEPISMKAAKAYAEKTLALQDSIAAVQRGIQAELDYADAQRDAGIAQRERMAGIAQEYNDMGRFAEAAKQGARAYRILQEETRLGSSLTPMERAEQADELRRIAVAFVDQQDMLDRATEQMDRMKQLAAGVGDAFGSMFEKAIIEGGKFSDVLKGLANDIAALLIRSMITQPIANGITGALNGTGGGGGLLAGIGKFFGGFFADGGNPPMGKVSVVGERGPELFVPKVPGTIIPNGGFRAANDNRSRQIVLHQTFNLQGATTSAQLRAEMVQVGRMAVEQARGMSSADAQRSAFKRVG